MPIWNPERCGRVYVQIAINNTVVYAHLSAPSGPPPRSAAPCVRVRCDSCVIKCKNSSVVALHHIQGHSRTPHYEWLASQYPMFDRGRLTADRRTTAHGNDRHAVKNDGGRSMRGGGGSDGPIPTRHAPSPLRHGESAKPRTAVNEQNARWTHQHAETTASRRTTLRRRCVVVLCRRVSKRLNVLLKYYHGDGQNSPC